MEQYALELLEEGKTTVSKAAEIAVMDILSFAVKIKEARIKWVKDDIVENDLKEFK